MNTPAKIIYDKDTKKNCRTGMIITLVMIVVGLVIGLVLSSSDDPNLKYSNFIGICMYMDIVGVPLFLIFLYNYCNTAVYLNRLKKNGFTVPEDRKEYDYLLHKLPRTGEPVVNRYTSDSKAAALISLLAFLGFLGADANYYLKWKDYEPDCVAFAVLIALGCLIFLVLAFVFYLQTSTEKYVDNVDVRTPSDTRKTRLNIFTAIFIILIVGVVGIFGIVCMDSMTNYIYKSKNGGYERTMYDYMEGATLEVTSDDLVDGVWDSALSNRAPQLSFEEVEGAQYYVVYMVNETDGSCVHWYIDDLHETELEAGNEEGTYRRLDVIPSYPGNTYSVSVYAMAGEPDSEYEITFDDASFSPDYFYYRILNISERGTPATYGNVIAYGYLSGSYRGS